VADACVGVALMMKPRLPQVVRSNRQRHVELRALPRP